MHDGKVSGDKIPKLHDVYTRFIALEERMAHCYLLLHERFLTNGPLAKFWAEAVLDELQHASILRFCFELGLFAETQVDITAADRISEMLDKVMTIVTAANITVDDAFHASLLMESSELDEAYHKLTRPVSKDHRVLYQTIRESLRLHHDRFADAVAEFTADNASIKAFRDLAKVEQRAHQRKEAS